ncbi:CubicO group peptidase, beta-lactamase class C family [Zhouia amylolytica]|uniref:CubicO group peptidase, beta-lactamase class C family n=1 Tax=Zhouia amylolytica TaxID=376730 RepID=A0A1I6VLU5_9FLAO|nr:serine hydrolase domain-containing protein [Zhouia amylolytica]SFT14591.1 CubicO group peptidase, beta-lactamase class C family [Zhouia amylolytica]
MEKFKPLAIILFLLWIGSCNMHKSNPDTIKKNIDDYLTSTMELHNIPGLALAVIIDDEIVYENYMGESSLESGELVNENTLFRIFSATKLITATGVFQLIENGTLNLDDNISIYLDNLLPQWQEVKIKNLLSHSSGLPDIIKYKSTLSDHELMDKLFKDKMDFAPGDQFRYNQTNYWLLAQIMEKVTGMTFDNYIMKNEFDNDTTGVLFSSSSQEIIPNRATRYFYNEKTKAFDKDTNNSGKRGHSGNGLNITLKRFMEWNKKLDNDQLLSHNVKSKMWEPFNFNNENDHFSYGWGYYPVNEINSYGFSGGNLAAIRKFINHKTTIILLSNGYQIPAYDIIINDIAKIAIPELRIQNLALEEDIMSLVKNSQFKEATLAFKKLKQENPNSDFDNLKWNINSIGNSYAYNELDLQKAFDIFQLNAEANPNWWVSKASLAEIYEINKDSSLAIENYKKAILLNKDNDWNYNELMKNKIDKLYHN